MRKRYVYTLLFAFSAFLISLPVSLELYNVFLNLYELFWSSQSFSEMDFLLILVMIFIVTWFILTFIGYLVGRQFEQMPELNNWLPLVLLGITLILFVFSCKWGMDFVNEDKNSRLCGEYCQSRGYYTSISPPAGDPVQTCYCSNGPDTEPLIVPIEDLK
ncbi:MAG: hypothetical protein IPP66_01315 [Anaerolineales bacterium]|nr:hypothetical protein [Anaerolineales bacterium]